MWSSILNQRISTVYQSCWTPGEQQRRKSEKREENKGVQYFWYLLSMYHSVLGFVQNERVILPSLHNFLFRIFKVEKPFGENRVYFEPSVVMFVWHLYLLSQIFPVMISCYVPVLSIKVSTIWCCSLILSVFWVIIDWKGYLVCLLLFLIGKTWVWLCIGDGHLILL